LSRHDKIVDRIAKKYKDKHHRVGVDVRPPKKAIEVAVSPPDLDQSIKQLNRSRKKQKYLVVAKELRENALKKVRGTGIGLMDGNGKIIKRSRKRTK